MIPPDQGCGLPNRHVATLKEIEEYCKSVRPTRP